MEKNKEEWSKKMDRIIGDIFLWSSYIMGMFLILFIIGMMFVVVFQTSKYMIVIPIITIIVLTPLLTTYIRGICKLDSKDFPTFPEF